MEGPSAYDPGDDFTNNLISVNDVASMFRKKIPKNSPPYVEKVIKANNKLVDLWQKNVVEKMANGNGKIQCTQVQNAWNIFSEGYYIRKYIELRDKGMIQRSSPEVLDFWSTYFSSLEVDEMQNYGVGCNSLGWVIIQDEIRMYCIDKKWEMVYSKSEKPYDWVKEARQHPDVMRGKFLPFDWDEETLRDIQYKITTVLRIQPTPDGENNLVNDTKLTVKEIVNMYKKKPGKNTPPYEASVVEANNSMVNKWKESLLSKLVEEDGNIEWGIAKEAWNVFIEGNSVTNYIKLRDEGMVRSCNPEVLNFWLDFFQNTDIETIHTYGTGCVVYGWILVQDKLRMICADRKWEEVYSKSDDPCVWLKEAREHPDVIKGKPHPFEWSNETAYDVHQKVDILIKIQPTPEN